MALTDDMLLRLQNLLASDEMSDSFSPASFNEENKKLYEQQRVLLTELVSVSVAYGHILSSDTPPRPIGCPLMIELRTKPTMSLVKQPLFVDLLTGGFPQYFSQVLPALLLNQLLPLVTASSVEMHVLCMGSCIDSVHPFLKFGGLDEAEPDKDIVNEVLEELFGKPAFQTTATIVNREFSPDDKPIRRVCVWFRVKNHVITWWWEKTNEGSICFVVDNLEAESKLSKMIVEGFISRVETGTIECSGLVHPLTSGDVHKLMHTCLIEFDDDMACVSYMARITLYLSMVDYSIFKIQGSKIVISNAVQAAGKLSDRVGFDFEQNVFHRFLTHLIHFCKTMTSKKKFILISPILASFVNIQHIRLLAVLPSEINIPACIQQYAYYGSRGFQTGGDCQGCTVCSHFQLLPDIRECVRLLDTMRLRTPRVINH
jgi:hypothetical protein